MLPDLSPTLSYKLPQGHPSLCDCISFLVTCSTLRASSVTSNSRNSWGWFDASEEDRPDNLRIDPFTHTLHLPQSFSPDSSQHRLWNPVHPQWHSFLRSLWQLSILLCIRMSPAPPDPSPSSWCSGLARWAPAASSSCDSSNRPHACLVTSSKVVPCDRTYLQEVKFPDSLVGWAPPSLLFVQ